MISNKENNIKVSIIIINYNGERFIKNCIDSLNILDMDKNNYEVIFADNFSTDNSVNLIKQNYSWVRLVKFKENYGFCKGNNLAASYAKGENLFFLNNDTIVEPYAIKRILGKMESDERIGICGCKMMNYDGSVTFHTGIGMDFLGWPVIKKNKIFYIEGSALMIRKNIFDYLEGFDEDYFIFHEDVDLCWRTRLLGYRIETIDTAIIYHYMGGFSGGGEAEEKKRHVTTSFRRYLSEKNTLSTLLKNYSFPYLIFIMPQYIFISSIEVLVFLFLGKLKVVKIYIDAYKWNIKNIIKTLSKRMKIQKNRTVSDTNIFRNMHKISGKLLVLKEFGIPKIKG